MKPITQKLVGLASNHLKACASYPSELELKQFVYMFLADICQTIADDVVGDSGQPDKSDPQHLQGMIEERLDIRTTLLDVIHDLKTIDEVIV